MTDFRNIYPEFDIYSARPFLLPTCSAVESTVESAVESTVESIMTSEPVDDKPQEDLDDEYKAVDKALYKAMKWYGSHADTGASIDVPYATGDLESEDKCNEGVPTYAEQEAADGSPFDPAHSGFALSHLDHKYLNGIGATMVDFQAGQKAKEWSKWVVLFPAKILPDTCANEHERGCNPGNEYNGVCMNYESGDLDVYRIFGRDLDGDNVNRDTSLKL